MGNSRKFVVVLDTETAPIVGCPNDGNAHPELSRVYDFGYTIVPKRGSVSDTVVSRSFVITDTFTDPMLMNSAYYKDKLPQYREGARFDGKGEWNAVSFLEAWTQFKRDCKQFGVTEVWAYNARFDRTALNATIAAYSGGYARFFTPYGVKWFDLWVAAQRITGTVRYVDWCYAHDMVTPSGNPKTSVESVTAYLNDDIDFAERHTALDDAMHEAAILERLYRYSHTSNPKTLGNGWRAAARIAKEKGYK